ncbi:polyprenyl synthetase family protein [Nocardia brasiliensis]|uniref:polyprenyl synthetase family protein n=1 Tax=Nocardia brasiliensis TaxID=37326 RepID=UPI001893889E|nr:polyprenyl synthetase family protein [Nocardia brasiliensis]MBF6130201.1 polyprenyl synthetase family protein [Nocardia brasiliensis]
MRATSKVTSASEILAETRRAVEPAHRVAIEGLSAELRLIAGYHAGWWDAQGAACDAVGKAVRPALALACARAVDGDDGVRASIPVAVAVELAHDFTLLHDDVMDGDRMRRHRPAAWTLFGRSQAILAGDALLVLAMDMLSSREQSTILADALLEVCAGQSADLALQKRTEVSLDECLAMAEGKTAALLGAACQLGACAAGADEQTARRYRELGRHLGIAYQLIDDLLGIWGDPATTGKPVGMDLVVRKKSLPVTAALASGTLAGECLAQLYRGGERLAKAEVARAAELIDAAGGRAWATAEADRQIRSALTALEAARPPAVAAAELRALLELITRRAHSDTIDRLE